MAVKQIVADWLDRQEVFTSPMLPGAKILHLREDVYSILARCPYGRGDTWIHVIAGPEKVLLIDTGFGIGDLRGYVESLAAGREVIVVNSHHHPDHIMGNVQFDRILIEEHDALPLEQCIYPEYWAEFCLHGKTLDDFFTMDDVVPFRKYEVVPVPDGYTWDLGGGHLVEIVWVSGHAPGLACFIDHKNRILFSTDAFMNPHPTPISVEIWPEGVDRYLLTVSSFREGIKRMLGRMDEFDVLYDSHGILEGPKSVIEDMLVVADAVVEHPHEDCRVAVHRGIEVMTKRYGRASIAYIDSRI